MPSPCSLPFFFTFPSFSPPSLSALLSPYLFYASFTSKLQTFHKLSLSFNVLLFPIFQLPCPSLSFPFLPYLSFILNLLLSPFFSFHFPFLLLFAVCFSCFLSKFLSPPLSSFLSPFSLSFLTSSSPSLSLPLFLFLSFLPCLHHSIFFPCSFSSFRACGQPVGVHAFLALFVAENNS